MGMEPRNADVYMPPMSRNHRQNVPRYWDDVPRKGDKMSRSLSLDDFHAPDPRRTPTDYNDPERAKEVHRSAGYIETLLAPVYTDGTPGTLYIWSDDNFVYRQQFNIVWQKPKRK